MNLTVIPLTWRQACAYVDSNHRHHKAPRGCKWAIGAVDGTGTLRGVALCGRPVSRHLGVDLCSLLAQHRRNDRRLSDISSPLLYRDVPTGSKTGVWRLEPTGQGQL